MVIVSRSELVDALKLAGKAVPLRSPIPVLETVLLKTEADALVIRSTDMDASFEIRLPYSGDTEISLTVPYKSFASFVASYPRSEVRLQQTEENLAIADPEGKIETAFRCWPPDEFPVIPAPPEKGWLPVSPVALSRALQLTSFCAAKDDPRAFLNGVLLDGKKEASKLHVVASDSTKLGHAVVPLRRAPDFRVIVGISDVPRLLLAASYDELELAVKDDFLFARFPKGYLTLRLVQEPYPDWEKVVPDRSEAKARWVFTSDVLDVLSRVLAIAEGPLYMSHWQVCEAGLQVSVHAPRGELKEFCDADVKLLQLGDEERMFRLNAKLLHDVLKRIFKEYEAIDVFYFGPTQALMFAASDQTYWLFMPIATEPV